MNNRPHQPISPNSASDALFREALVLHREGDIENACRQYREFLTFNASYAPAWGNLGSILRRLGYHDEALACMQRAIELEPYMVDFHYNLGNAHRESGSYSDALIAYARALECDPCHAMVHYNQGLTYQYMDRIENAKTAYRKALLTDAELYDAHLNLGTLLAAEGYISKAMDCYWSAASLQPDKGAAYNNLAQVLHSAARFDEALTISKRTLQLEPGLHEMASNILMNLQYHPEMDEAALLKTAQSFGRRFSNTSPLPRQPLNGRPLRVGYVSADLRSHPVGLFLRGVLRHHNPARVKAYCYSNSNRTDEVTVSLATAAKWRAIASIDDKALMKQIQEDEIDCLVDLAGHTSGNRLPLFALRAAPLQVSWLGYFATTGLNTMDAVIMDRHHVPLGSEQYFSEPVVCLPHTRFCYSPVPFAPEIVSPPCRKKGYVTFGSFNNTAKINDSVIASWAEIIRNVPESRLLLKWRTLADTSYGHTILKRFDSLGVARERLELRGQSSHRRLLEEYGDIDIALDPYPFTGGLTSCEALWMGIPVITLPGTRSVSRQTLSMLATIGLNELIAVTQDDYIAKAILLAADPERLLALRMTMRERMLASPLMDFHCFTKDFEETLLSLWEHGLTAGANL